MPPAALTSSRHSSKPRICEVESLLSAPVCDDVKPIVSVCCCACAAVVASAAAAASRQSLIVFMLILLGGAPTGPLPRLRAYGKAHSPLSIRTFAARGDGVQCEIRIFELADGGRPRVHKSPSESLFRALRRGCRSPW